MAEQFGAWCSYQIGVQHGYCWHVCTVVDWLEGVHEFVL